MGALASCCGTVFVAADLHNRAAQQLAGVGRKGDQGRLGYGSVVDTVNSYRHHDA